MLVRPNANPRRQRSNRQAHTAWRDRPVAIAPHRGHAERRSGRSRWQHDHRQLAKVLYVASSGDGPRDGYRHREKHEAGVEHAASV